MKRIELNKKVTKGIRARVSRTSKPNLSFKPFRNLTFNTSHGLRVSKSFYGLTLGFQRSNSVFRGRWDFGKKLNLNLSKSGFSLSVKNKVGAINLRNPNRSSATFLGIQVRGKKALEIHRIYLTYYIISKLVSLIFFLSFLILKTSIILTMRAVIICFCIFKFVYFLFIFLFWDIPRQLMF